jgi:hypothetical protein
MNALSSSWRKVTPCPPGLGEDSSSVVAPVESEIDQTVFDGAGQASQGSRLKRGSGRVHGAKTENQPLADTHLYGASAKILDIPESWPIRGGTGEEGVFRFLPDAAGPVLRDDNVPHLCWHQSRALRMRAAFCAVNPNRLAAGTAAGKRPFRSAAEDRRHSVSGSIWCQPICPSADGHGVEGSSQ